METTAVQQLWSTAVWLGTEEVQVVRATINGLLSGECPQDSADPASVLCDPAATQALFGQALHQLTGQSADVSLEIQVWRAGFSIGLAYSSAPWQGWCPLAIAGGDGNSQSGTLSLHDPRSGCAAVSVPGLSWGSPLTIKPEPGLTVLHPGWLAYSSTPVQPGHTIVMLAAAVRAHQHTVRSGDPR